MQQSNKKRDADYDYDVNYMDRIIQRILKEREEGVTDDVRKAFADYLSEQREHEGHETDAVFIADWTRWAEGQTTRGVTWASGQHPGEDTEVLKQQWSAYLDRLPPQMRYYSAQYVDRAIEHGTLHKLYMPPTNGDPLE
jgi:hypothetical protein